MVLDFKLFLNSVKLILEQKKDEGKASGVFS